MIDYSTRQHMAKAAANRSLRNGILPAIWTGNKEGFHIPFIGERVPRGWKRTERELLFVDTSGFGTDSEPALSQSQMFAALNPGMGYALVELGQFQGYLAEYQPPREKKHA